MQGTVDNLGIIGYNSFRTVTMMHIPVQNSHPLNFRFSQGVVSGDSCIRKETKSHPPFFSSMMTGRTSQDKSRIVRF